MNIQQQNIYSNNFQQPNSSMNSSEDYDPLAVTFIEPKNQMSKMILPSTNLEPKSLDLAPVNNTYGIVDDEFSEFQCAQFTIAENKNNYEFTDFQSAFDTLSLKEITNEKDDGLTSTIDVTSNSFKSQHNLISDQDDIHDKYEVFRTLAAETIDFENLTKENNYNDLLDTKSIQSIEENVQNCDVYDDEFGDFLCVEEVSSQFPNKPEIVEVDWKNVQVCITHNEI